VYRFTHTGSPVVRNLRPTHIVYILHVYNDGIRKTGLVLDFCNQDRSILSGNCCPVWATNADPLDLCHRGLQRPWMILDRSTYWLTKVDMEYKGPCHPGHWHFDNIARSHIICTRSYSWPERQVHMYTFYWKSFRVNFYSHKRRIGFFIYPCVVTTQALSGRMLESIAFLDWRASHHFQTLYKQDRTALTVG
jgi:hypothetical protein